jgi:hypothetical protein
VEVARGKKPSLHDKPKLEHRNRNSVLSFEECSKRIEYERSIEVGSNSDSSIDSTGALDLVISCFVVLHCVFIRHIRRPKPLLLMLIVV